MAAIGSLKFEILVRVGDGEPISLGTVSAPLAMSSLVDGVLQVDTRDTFDFVRESIHQVFRDDASQREQEEEA